MAEKCPYCGEDAISGRLLCQPERIVGVQRRRPTFPRLLHCRPYFLRRDIQTDALCCKACRTIIFHYKEADKAE